MIPIPSILCIRLLRGPLTWLRRKRNHTGKVVLLPIAAAVLALTSCNDDEANKHTPPVTITDTQPVGDGLAVIGFAMVAGCVVIVLGRLLR